MKNYRLLLTRLINVIYMAAMLILPEGLTWVLLMHYLRHDASIVMPWRMSWNQFSLMFGIYVC